MFRQGKTIPRESSSPPSRRRERRSVPSLSGSASCLEGRMVLSGAGPAAHAVHHAVVYHGHNVQAQSRHGIAAAVTPATVLGATAASGRSLATFSTTRTGHSVTVAVSSPPRLGGTSAPNLSCAVGGARIHFSRGIPPPAG